MGTAAGTSANLHLAAHPTILLEAQSLITTWTAVGRVSAGNGVKGHV